MADTGDILKRKDQHLDLALAQRAGLASRASPFDRFRLEHNALPELALDQIDLSTTFLGRRLDAPLLISSMTGGPVRGGIVNRNLAEAARALGIGLAVGSQRVALEHGGDCGFSREIRNAAPTALLLANFGAAQLVRGYGADEARRAVEMIGADGLIVHLNPLQEAIQPGGDRDWRGVLRAIEQLAATLDKPLVVKEVGFGISASVAQRLCAAGVAAIDIAGAGGTDWAQIEGERSADASARATARAFEGWGVPTPVAIAEARAACPDLPIIGSGGIRNGVDAAKALRLGADLVGQAGGVLEAALVSAEAVVDHFAMVIRQLRTACFSTGAANIADLRRVRLTEN